MKQRRDWVLVEKARKAGNTLKRDESTGRRLKYKTVRKKAILRKGNGGEQGG